MIEIIEHNQIIMKGRAILEATIPGTRKFENGIMTDPGIVVKRIENHNIICNEGLLLLAGFYVDESATYDTGATYCEIGTGSTAPAAGDTALTTYHGRKAITSITRSNYVCTAATFFTAAEATAVIAEAGIWGGGDAAAGEATGLLFSHFLASYDNSAGTFDITISHVLTIARG